MTWVVPLHRLLGSVNLVRNLVMILVRTLMRNLTRSFWVALRVSLNRILVILVIEVLLGVLPRSKCKGLTTIWGNEGNLIIRNRPTLWRIEGIGIGSAILVLLVIARRALAIIRVPRLRLNPFLVLRFSLMIINLRSLILRVLAILLFILAILLAVAVLAVSTSLSLRLLILILLSSRYRLVTLLTIILLWRFSHRNLSIRSWSVVGSIPLVLEISQLLWLWALVANLRRVERILGQEYLKSIDKSIRNPRLFLHSSIELV